MTNLSNARPRWAPALLLAATALVAACGGSSSSGGDTTPPTVVITDSVPGATATGDVTFNFTFSEDVGTSFTAADVTVTGGTKGAFTRASATFYTLVVAPTAATAGTINVSLAAGAFADLAGNGNTAAATASQAYDLTPVALTQMSLPVTFDAATVDYGVVGFGGAEDPNSSIVADPVDPANKVVKVIKPAAAMVWAGTTITAVVAGVQTGLSSKIPFGAADTRMTLRVYSPVAGIPVRLKVEDHTNPNISVETEATTTLVNAWETLTFDFTVPTVPPTAPLNLASNYDKASVFFDFGTNGVERTYYFDDLVFIGGTTADTTPPTVAITDSVAGATAAGDVTFTFTFSEDVGTSFVAGDVTVTGGTAGAFTRSSATVYTLVVSPPAASTGTLTVEVAAGAFSDVAGNASTAAATGSQAFDTTGAALTQMTLPVTFDSATVEYGLVGFEGAEDSTIVADPAGGANQVARVVKSATAQPWAGTTITALAGTVQTGFASRIPFTLADTKMTVRVYSPVAGIPVRLKVEDHTNPTVSVETEATTSLVDAWETLTFDFTVPTTPPTAPLNLASNYDKATIFFNFGTGGAATGARTYYFDDVAFVSTGGGGSGGTQVVFADDYAAGVTFAGFGGATNVISLDTAEAHSGTSSLKVLVPAAGYTGGAMVAATPQDLSAYNAVTFWAKASKAVTLNVTGLGDAAAAGPSYKAESLQIPLDGTWSRHVIPIPVPSKLTASQGLFHFAEGPEEGSYTLWIDDVAYVDLPAAEVGTASAANITWGGPAAVAVGATFDIGSATNAVAWGPPVTSNGGNLTNVGFRYFTLTSSNPAVATVDGDGVVTGLSAGTTEISAKLGALVVAGVKVINVTAPLAVLSVPAPTPTRAAADVLSLYNSSGTYTNVPVDTWRTGWSDGSLADYTVPGSASVVKAYSNLSYVGVEFFNPKIDASGYTTFHVDVWTPNATKMGVKLVSFPAAGGVLEFEVPFNATSTPAITQGTWIGIDIPLSAFAGVPMNTLAQLLFTNNAGGVERGTLYIDNVYFWK